ncbi:heat shock protein beta-1-like [Ixodes scapularis]|uniref:Heat shock protein 20.6, putative n=2 Tax=Ixodes TaxID=6944 RepID=B7PIN1_IXOSC|nr:heat shock protein beta-1 [Ixodes scapularis]XP_042142109.1 heat shock protein beta-1 [Ixodes scapularis]XP_042142110.1 heat shock protein beta-1 [Ixodes scapularis]XP_042142320.1 heat shock protein beta-1-like [Ixodes scapularis]XP_042142321.1 heat shock protein beta-1-like [Ixodes scapularis]XP_042142322.1 heat shock protein beta-1-like [Ixodes scapularis]XP_042142323.1 heat shock protein beta-1-like [Ixodes scapularis]EEC06453.1 heat shock protein 20.6, putative [Ixodes scapularis]|eukprot:XP_002405513.1 heat shock protein 20.6, putative [Ixodes scapularis]
MAPERRVPIQKSELSILDNEFSSIRERFEAEMKKMEEEMSRFRSQLLDHERDFFSRAPGSQTGLGTGSKTWLDGMNSPLIQDAEDGSKQLKLRFDVSQYVPEEIVVKTVDNRLQVHAKHEEKSENRSVYREYNREFLLPKGTNPEQIRSSLSKDGILTIEAPLPALEAPNRERTIPIDKK